ncbi:electron transfer flavoprotein subunit beta/FixA family protein [Paenibacillus thermoaerophilus]|uniref:Electron transfer flavoprotein subunit beta n=1 Tax=Paenibacillus thermoaerophilus TaxID=1215385 RepID=A0ABW2V7K0_9BACL|nr:electron transfer flavoprotein subunit beta/FixA family protein [Paenibacillus thermoaerophilus]TMV17159.1 electron transfer flavoprotein subunit beta/FixA family protein [Paenibacillus thermoaerophilus]
MIVAVCLKQTPDTEERIRIESGALAERDLKYIVNPYDEYALEEALRIKEKFGGEVVAVTVGPERAESALRTALAMGADRAVRIGDSACLEDEGTVAASLAAYLASLRPDLILAGHVSIDNGAAQGGARVAEALGLPLVSGALKLTLRPEQALAVVEREGSDGNETVEAPLPLVVTAQQGLNEPRYPSLPGIMKAKKKPVETLSAADLGLSTDRLSPGSRSARLEPAPPRQAGIRLTGEASAVVAELLDRLRDEAKVLRGEGS